MKVITAMVLAVALLSYWYANTFPNFALWSFVVATGFTFIGMWLVIKKPLTKASTAAAGYLNATMNSMSWKINFINHLAMIAGYACAGVWPLVLVSAVYLVGLTWFRNKAVKEWEKNNSFGA